MDNNSLVRVIFGLLRDRSKLIVKSGKLYNELIEIDASIEENELKEIISEIKNKENYIEEHLLRLKNNGCDDIYVLNSIKIIELEVLYFNVYQNPSHEYDRYVNEINLKKYPVQHIVFDIINLIRFENINGMPIHNIFGFEVEKIKYYIWRYLSQNKIVTLDKGDIYTDWMVVSDNFNKFYGGQLLILKIGIVIKYIILFYLNIDFKNKYERKVAHYTSVDVGIKLIKNETKMRLSTTEFMNDPSEGEILFDFLNLSNKTDIYNETINHLSFVSCFTFNHNSLNQFRLYGRTNFIECSGISLTFKNSYFYDERQGKTKTNLYRCIYLDPRTGYVKIASRNVFSFYQEHNNENKDVVNSKKIKYFKMIQMKEEIIGDLLDVLSKLKSASPKVNNYLSIILEPINLLVKHCAFADEDECRIIVQYFMEDEQVQYFDINNTTYIDYSNEIKGHVDNIYIGSSAKDLETYIRLTVAKQQWKKQPKIRVNDSPYRAHSKIDRIEK